MIGNSKMLLKLKLALRGYHEIREPQSFSQPGAKSFLAWA
jgi:hypothetical protein